MLSPKVAAAFGREKSNLISVGSTEQENRKAHENGVNQSPAWDILQDTSLLLLVRNKLFLQTV